MRLISTAAYRAWHNMKGRCFNKNSPKYKDHGGRGITVDAVWLGKEGFKNFLAHVGPRPSPQHSLDRFPNNDGNYEPGNVRWATLEQQANNKRNNTFATVRVDPVLRRRAKRAADAAGTTVTALMNEALRTVIAVQELGERLGYVPS